MNSETKTCQNCNNQFTIEPEDFAFYEKIQVPPPTWCSICRFKRRAMFRNERKLYRRRCDGTGKEVFAMFHPKAPIKVYDKDYWWSDKWEAMDYGRDYDFSKPFFMQFQGLMQVVPWFSRSVNDSVNSDYCMNCGWLKDCYMVFNADHCENCLYSIDMRESKDSIDNFYLSKSELCYGSFGCVNCHRVIYSRECEDCHDIYFCKDCRGCSNCVGCVGLRNKKYYIFNQPYSKDDYDKKVNELRLGTYSGLKRLSEQFGEFIKKFPVKYAHVLHSYKCSGDYIYDSKNVKDSYLVDGGENLRYCQSIRTSPGARDSYDYCIWAANAELIYESCQVGNEVSGLKFCLYTFPGLRQEYSIACQGSQDVFGCAGLKKKQYCILNKQYSKEDYEAMVKKIKAHMDEMPYHDKGGRLYKYGEYFPPELSPFAYNETWTYDFFPLTQEQVISEGLMWHEPEEKNYKTELNAEDLPETIQEVKDEILTKILACSHKGRCSHDCTKAFRIVSPELSFYRQLNLPLPRECFNCRHGERFVLRNPISLLKRSCQCAGQKSDNGVYQNTAKHFHKDSHCPNEFETSYAPERPEIVYCEQCYQSEVV